MNLNPQQEASVDRAVELVARHLCPECVARLADSIGPGGADELAGQLTTSFCEARGVEVLEDDTGELFNMIGAVLAGMRMMGRPGQPAAARARAARKATV